MIHKKLKHTAGMRNLFKRCICLSGLTVSLPSPLGKDIYGCSCRAALQMFAL